MTSKYYYPTTHERGVDIMEGGGGGVVRYKAESMSDLNMQRRRQQLEQTELELSERRARNMAIKVRSNNNNSNTTSEAVAKSVSVQNVAASQARSYSNDSIDSRKSDDSWWSARDDSVQQDKHRRKKHQTKQQPQQQKQRIINYYDARDDDYESLDDGYYVYNDESGSRDSLGLYEDSNLGQRLAQSERELSDQRTILVANFRHLFGINPTSYTAPPINKSNSQLNNSYFYDYDYDDAYGDADEDESKDPFAVLERQAEQESLKHRVKHIKEKGRDAINQAILMVPKTKYRQQKMLQKRILKSEIEGKFKEPHLEDENDEWLTEKILKRLNPASDEWKPIFSNTTGKTRMLIKHTIRQYSNSTAV